MIQSQVQQLYVTSLTTGISASINCTNCAGVRPTNFSLKIYRKGTELACQTSIPTLQQYPNCANPPTPANGPCPVPVYPNAPAPPTYFLAYPGYQLVGNVITFHIDSQLTGVCQGAYRGDIFVNANQCGFVDLIVGDVCTITLPYITNNTGLGNTLQPTY